MPTTKIGNLEIDFDKGGVMGPYGQTISFRPQTFLVFSYLCKNRGRVVTKDELLERLDAAGAYPFLLSM